MRGSTAKKLAEAKVKKDGGQDLHNYIQLYKEIVEEDPDKEITYISSTKIDWRFKVDSKIIQKIAPNITNYSQMTKDQRRKYDKLEKKEHKKIGKEVIRRKGGALATAKELMGMN